MHLVGARDTYGFPPESALLLFYLLSSSGHGFKTVSCVSPLRLGGRTPEIQKAAGSVCVVRGGGENKQLQVAAHT